MTINDWVKASAKRLSTTGISSARLDCLLLLEHVLGIDRAMILAEPELELSVKRLNSLNELFSRRIKGMPIAYLRNFSEFSFLDFYIDERVLIPRVETEDLLEETVFRAPKNARITELGTGSGALAITLKTWRPDLKVIATDISGDALAVAKKNQEEYATDIELIEADLLPVVYEADIVVANLPYVPTGRPAEPSIAFEPDLALFAGNDGLDIYRRLLKQISAKNINPLLIIEAEPDQKAELVKMANKSGYALEKHHNFCFVFRSI
ncbi:peptide chain release factor N(5)-glutamine methyltransferase [Candidatus Saccharibacteria bacterium]|nr:peptide chain release factor N(5)-glutamine methyltransferase [Candidatus Saccharibacteria bacterium]